MKKENKKIFKKKFNKNGRGTRTMFNPSVEIKNATSGITLIALVITIVVMLILAGVSIATLTGENGLLTKVAKAKDATEKAQAAEQSQLSQLNNELQNRTDNGYEESKKVNRPQLTTGMTRIMYDDDGKTILDGQTGWDEENWYNYTTENKNWANAQTKDGSMWVWIPRFAYKITYTNPSNKSAGGIIDVVFLKGTTNLDKDGNDVTSESYVDEKNVPGAYIVHPCFKNGNGNYSNGEWKEEITGFWIAKFEAGLPDESSAAKTTSVSGMANSYYPVFQGLKGAYNYINVSQCFLLSQAITESDNPYGITNADSHLTKNSEWGAVAYLSYSKYGKTGGTYYIDKEVYINNVTYNGNKTSVRGNGVYAVTGYAGSSKSAGPNTLTADAKLDKTVGTTSYAWYTEEGTQASTTGTIYGVYDMSGATSEYTSGYMKQENNSTLLDNLKGFGYGFIFTDDTKTKFVGNTPYVTEYPAYESGGLIEALGTSKYGDAISETWGWFGDWTDNNASGPFPVRGGHWVNTSAAGVFAFDDAGGGGYGYNVRFPFCLSRAVAL